MDNMDNRNGKNSNDVDKAIAEIDAAIAKISQKLIESEKLASKEESMPKARLAIDAMKRKMIAIVTAMSIAVVSFVYSSFAYFTATFESPDNVIASGGASVEHVDLTHPSESAPGLPSDTPGLVMTILPGATVMKTISITNTGHLDLFVRAKIESEIILSERNVGRESEIDYSLIGYTLDESIWILDGEYYYFDGMIRHGETIPKFISTVNFSMEMGNLYKDSIIKVRVIFEVVQANGNGENAFEATGWATASSKGGEQS